MTTRLNVYKYTSYSFGFHCIFFCLVTRRYGTKVADEESVEFFWSIKSIPMHKFPLIIK